MDSLRALLSLLFQNMDSDRRVEFLEENIALSIYTTEEHSCQFTDQCPHAFVPCCSGPIFRTNGGFACRAFLDDIRHDDGTFGWGPCGMCDGRECTVRLVSDEPISLEDYLNMAGETFPWDRYSEDAVEFFRVNVLPFFWEHRGDDCQTLLYDVLREEEARE
jgi:hypothetical protein